MTNFDPGGILVLLTVIPAVIAGVVSVSLAHLLAWLGYGDYERNVAAVLALMVVAWTGAAFVVSTGMLLILSVTLSMVGAYVATRSVAASSYGWWLGVALLYVAFAVASALGVYQGVDQTGRPLGVVASHLSAFFFGGLFVFGVVGGAIVRAVGRLDWPSGRDR